MFLLELKNCTCHVQMRQFLKKPILNIFNGKNLNTTNAKHYFNKFVTGNDNKSCFLPNLIWQNPHFVKIEISLKQYYQWCTFFQKNEDLTIASFLQAIGKAIVVTSHALASQDFEELKPIVRKRTLTLLQRRIICLQENQISVLSIKEEDLYFLPARIVIRDKGDRQKVVEIIIYGRVVKDIPTPDKLFPVTSVQVYYNYVFQRTYVDMGDTWTGGEWTVKSINYYA